MRSVKGQVGEVVGMEPSNIKLLLGPDKVGRHLFVSVSVSISTGKGAEGRQGSKGRSEGRGDVGVPLRRSAVHHGFRR
jgi:hypothetical protein